MAKNERSLIDCIKQMGFKTVEFADLTGYSRYWLYLVESGKHVPHKVTRVEAAVKLAKYTIDERFHTDLKILEKQYAERLRAWEEMKEILLKTEVKQDGTDGTE